MSQKRIKVRINSIEDYMSLFDGIFSLTDTEKEILGAFVKMKVAIDKSDSDDNPFSTESKKKVAKVLGRENFNTLNTYIKRLKDKGVIQNTVDGYKIHPAIMPQGEQRIIFELNRG